MLNVMKLARNLTSALLADPARSKSNCDDYAVISAEKA